MKNGKIIYTIIGIFIAIFLAFGIGYLYFYTGKVKTLECQATSSYFQNERNFQISFQRDLPIKLEHWTIYATEKEDAEFQSLYQANVAINDFRKVQNHVIGSSITKENNRFTLYTVVDTRWVNLNELEKIDGFYKMIFEDGKKIKNVKNYLEKNGYICTVQ